MSARCVSRRRIVRRILGVTAIIDSRLELRRWRRVAAAFLYSFGGYAFAPIPRGSIPQLSQGSFGVRPSCANKRFPHVSARVKGPIRLGIFHFMAPANRVIVLNTEPCSGRRMLVLFGGAPAIVLWVRFGLRLGAPTCRRSELLLLCKCGV